MVSILVTCLKVGQVNYFFQDCRKANSTFCCCTIHQANANLKDLAIPIKAERVCAVDLFISMRYPFLGVLSNSCFIVYLTHLRKNRFWGGCIVCWVYSKWSREDWVSSMVLWYSWWVSSCLMGLEGQATIYPVLSSTEVVLDRILCWFCFKASRDYWCFLSKQSNRNWQ